MNKAFIILISCNAGAGLTFTAMYAATRNPLLLMMGGIFLLATLALVMFLFVVKKRFKDL